MPRIRTIPTDSLTRRAIHHMDARDTLRDDARRLARTIPSYASRRRWEADRHDRAAMALIRAANAEDARILATIQKD